MPGRLKAFVKALAILAVLLAGILLVTPGCRGNDLRSDDIREVTFTAQSLDPEAMASWQATDEEVAALVMAINAGEPYTGDGGATPRVIVNIYLHDGPVVTLWPTSQGIHYLDRDSRRSVLQGELLDAQFDYIEAKAARVGTPAR